MTGERDAILDSLRRRLDAFDPKDLRQFDFHVALLEEIDDYPLELRVDAWRMVGDHRRYCLGVILKPRERDATLEQWLSIATKGLSPMSRDRVRAEIGAHYDDAVKREGRLVDDRILWLQSKRSRGWAVREALENGFVGR